MKKHICSRKGISLVEVVVALVVISLVSAATISVMILSVEAEAKSVTLLEVKNTAENAIDCYRFTEGEEGAFIHYLNKTAEGKAFAGQNGRYVSDGDGYSVVITLLAEQNGFSYQAVNDSGKEIYAFTFHNGGGQE